MADGDLTRLIVTYTYICVSRRSSRSRPSTFSASGMLPYRYFLKCYPAPSVAALYPIIIHARTLDQ